MERLIMGLSLLFVFFLSFLSLAAFADVTLIPTNSQSVASADRVYDMAIDRLERQNSELKMDIVSDKKLGANGPSRDGLKVTLIRVRK